LDGMAAAGLAAVRLAARIILGRLPGSWTGDRLSAGGILWPVFDDVRKYAQTLAEQMSSLAAGFLEWSAEARASLMHEVKGLVARQVDEMGLATKQELGALRRRIERLEKRLPAEPAGRPKPPPKTRKATPKGTTRSAGSGRR